MKTLQIKVIGKVQGVGFRFYAQKRAKEFNILGFVKNMPDGSVYIEAEGDDSDMNTYVSWCERGPAWSRVQETRKSEIPFCDFKTFEIR